MICFQRANLLYFSSYRAILDSESNQAHEDNPHPHQQKTEHTDPCFSCKERDTKMRKEQISWMYKHKRKDLCFLYVLVCIRWSNWCGRQVWNEARGTRAGGERGEEKCSQMKRVGGWGGVSRGHVASPCTCSLRCRETDCIVDALTDSERWPFFLSRPSLMQLREISIIMLHIADWGGNVARGMLMGGVS